MTPSAQPTNQPTSSSSTAKLANPFDFVNGKEWEREWTNGRRTMNGQCEAAKKKPKEKGPQIAMRELKASRERMATYIGKVLDLFDHELA
jgi:hypothetical protein